MILNTFWKILLVIVALWYVYITWVLLTGKKTKILNLEKNEKNDENLQINTKFVNKSANEQTDLEAILNQVEEVENNSKLLEAFRKGSNDDNIDYSLTSKKNENFKVIRNKDSANKKDSESGT